ncbi:hypothetical protein DOTSEDRAFT_27763 [Dothistroma septosporum NZE10]|uniref:Uncharacterized protein n=1 Tax=Dothistroma septosporum (strain NZE10 / CBS 128990) TaxID=675120 RepID=N1PEV0_DOTSN|nr:hypothetical protein DOTSEDRAFT_27763 [Dothistroma septosporum NZE10]
MPTIPLATCFDFSFIRVLPDLTPEQVAIANISDDPADFLRGMAVYKIEPIPSPRPGAASALQHELKYTLRKQVPGVWLADYAEGDGFAAGIPGGIDCPLRTQLGRYTVTKIERPRDSESWRDKIVAAIARVLVGSKDVVVDLSNGVAFRCGLKQVREI